AEAQRLFREAIRLDGDNPQYRALLGRSLFAEGKHQEAERHFRDAVAARQDDPAYQADLGRARYEQQNHVAAEDAFRKAVQLAPGQPHQAIAPISDARFSNAVDLPGPKTFWTRFKSLTQTPVTKALLPFIPLCLRPTMSQQ